MKSGGSPRGLVASNASASVNAGPGFNKAATGAADTMEDKMRMLIDLELTRCTKPQRWYLYQQVLGAMVSWPEGSLERGNAMLNIQHIRIFLARREYTPC